MNISADIESIQPSSPSIFDYYNILGGLIGLWFYFDTWVELFEEIEYQLWKGFNYIKYWYYEVTLRQHHNPCHICKIRLTTRLIIINNNFYRICEQCEANLRVN